MTLPHHSPKHCFVSRSKGGLPSRIEGGPSGPRRRSLGCWTAAGRGGFLAGVLLVVALIGINPPVRLTAAALEKPEEDVKAAYLYNFGVFTEWPASKFSKADSPFVIGVLGDRDVERAMDKVARTNLVNGRVMQVRRVTLTTDLNEVHMIFVGREQNLDPVLARLRAVRGLLTVGENNQFAARGGMFNLVLEKGETMRYEINPPALEKAGLKPKALLIRSALRVISAEKTKEKEDR
jgi:hypothetical protein